jgi:hypothetical protein
MSPIFVTYGCTALSVAVLVWTFIQQVQHPERIGRRSERFYQRLTNMLILSAAFLGVSAAGLDRSTGFSLQLLVLSVGSAAYNLGSASASAQPEAGGHEPLTR